jgi:hypothetical protein
VPGRNTLLQVDDRSVVHEGRVDGGEHLGRIFRVRLTSQVPLEERRFFAERTARLITVMPSTPSTCESAGANRPLTNTSRGQAFHRTATA